MSGDYQQNLSVVVVRDEVDLDDLKLSLNFHDRGACGEVSYVNVVRLISCGYEVGRLLGVN